MRVLFFLTLPLERTFKRFLAPEWVRIFIIYFLTDKASFPSGPALNHALDSFIIGLTVLGWIEGKIKENMRNLGKLFKLRDLSWQELRPCICKAHLRHGYLLNNQ